MRQIVYALRFQGTARRIGPDGNILKTTASAPGCMIRSRIGADGLDASSHAVQGEEATFESEMVVTGETTFQRAGTIVFGPGGHRLRVSTVGSSYLGPASDDEHRHGAALWRIDEGEGQFAGAHGLIASAFVLTDAGEVTDIHLGVVYVL